MLGRLILGLIWLTCVQSDTLNNAPMAENGASMDKASMAMPMVAEDSMAQAEPISKSKRFLSHHHSSPCPPYYPHFHTHQEPMYAVRPYGPPSYPKNDIHVQHHSHQAPQFIHQPTYTSYVPKQTVQYVKQQLAPPIYHHPVVSPPIHQPIHPIQPAIFKPPPRWFPFKQETYEHKVSYPKQPIFAYAPAYHKPMPMDWQPPVIKKIDYPVTQLSYPKTPIIYKPEPPKCEPCIQHPPPPPPPPPQHHVHQQSYVKVVQPTVHQLEHSPPSKVYLPAPAYQPIIKPCAK